MIGEQIKRIEALACFPVLAFFYAADLAYFFLVVTIPWYTKLDFLTTVQDCWESALMTEAEVDTARSDAWTTTKIIYFFASSLPLLNLILGGLEFVQRFPSFEGLHTPTVLDVRDHAFGFINFQIGVVLLFTLPDMIGKWRVPSIAPSCPARAF